MCSIWYNTSHRRGIFFVQIGETLQFCPNHISVWCVNANHNTPYPRKPMTRELEHHKNARFRTLHRDYHWMVREERYTQNHIIICDIGYIFPIYIPAASILERLFYNASHQLYGNSVGWLWRSLLKNEITTSKGRDPSRPFLMYRNSHWILMFCQSRTETVIGF